ncbi:MAG TPA: biotin/lipoyl-containing protein, partial [Acidimicrobiales bacterium]
MELVTMPQLGETVTEGTITRWYKQVGDAVAVDDVLFEVSTEKVDTEVPSAHAGFLRAVHVPEGDTVPVGALLAVITATADEPLDEVPTGAPHGDPAVAPAPAAAATAPTRPDREANGFLSPAVRGVLDEHGLRPEQVIGTG